MLMAVSHEVPEESTPSTRTEKPRRFGRYTLMHKIAHGGMATLFLGRLDGPEGFEKFLAVKKIHPHLAEERQFVRMFLDEARFAARIQHPNVVQIFELGEVGGEYFFAMEYLEGESLAAVMKAIAAWKEPPPYALVAHMIARAADGLHAAHELRGPDGVPLGLVHRDVSPQNILATYDGLVKVVDFGIAKAAGRLAHTATGELKGKYAYMAPEQILGKGTDRRVDIFSLGVVLYEAATVRRLFKSENELLTLDKITRHQIPPPSTIDPHFPRVLEGIILKALRKEPDERYQTCAELAAHLDSFVVSQSSVANTAQVGAWMRHHFVQEAEQKRRMLNIARSLPAASQISDFGATKKRVPFWVYAVLAAVLALGSTFAVLHWAFSEPEPQTGTVRIHATPVEGQVVLDGAKAVGTTPLEIGGLALGRHTALIKAKGHQPRETSFMIQKAGQLVSVIIPLEPDAAKVGVLEVPAPVGLSVSIDGLQQPGKTPSRLELPPGAHKVRLVAHGYEPYEQTVTIVEGRTVALAVPPLQQIEPEEGPNKGPDTKGPRKRDRFGYLSLRTNPWAEVYLGGRKLGTTPLIKAKLPSGTRTLKLLPEGTGPPRHIRVNIQPDETTRKSIPL